MSTRESLAADLAALTRTIDNPDADLETQLRAVVQAARLAVASYLGMTLTVVVNEQPVSVTARDEGTTQIGASLRIPLSVASSPNATSALTLYAATPGALVDLGADLSHALDLPRSAVAFDEHLSWPADGSGVNGRDTHSALNQAIGVLIERGSTPSAAGDQLRLLAEGNGTAVRSAAEQVLRDARRDLDSS